VKTGRDDWIRTSGPLTPSPTYIIAGTRSTVVLLVFLRPLVAVRGRFRPPDRVGVANCCKASNRVMASVLLITLFARSRLRDVAMPQPIANRVEWHAAFQPPPPESSHSILMAVSPKSNMQPAIVTSPPVMGYPFISEPTVIKRTPIFHRR
jgi:hypothetical protein